MVHGSSWWTITTDTMKISIHDHEQNRAIIAQVPDYLADANASSDDIAEAIMTALGLSSGNCEYMIGEFQAHMDGETYNEDKTGMYKLDELTQDFKEDALEALENLKD